VRGLIQNPAHQLYRKRSVKSARWEARLTDVVKPLRCTTCGKREGEAKVHPLVAPRGRGPAH
jgi:hypothetical protein